MMIAGILLVVGALALTAALTTLVRRIALARGFVDRPGGHKAHAEPTPLGGGIAIVATLIACMIAGALLAIAVARSEALAQALPEEIALLAPGALAKTPQLAWIALGLIIVFAVGLIDDKRGLPASLRLAIHLGVGAMLYFAGVRITAFIQAPLWSLLLTSLWIAGITSAFNLLDNMDGLASGVAFICAMVLAAALSAPAPQYFVIALLLITAGAAAGFWMHNRPPARIFMGDAGSTALGYMIAVAAVLATFYGEGERTRTHAIAVPLLALAIPLYDTLSVVVLRIRRGVSPFSADRNHMSHRLLKIGLSKPAALATIYLATLATGAGALLVDRVSSSGAILLLAQGALITGIIAVLEIAAGRAIGRGAA